MSTDFYTTGGARVRGRQFEHAGDGTWPPGSVALRFTVDTREAEVVLSPMDQVRLANMLFELKVDRDGEGA